MTLFYGDMTNYDSTDFTVYDIPEYVGDTDLTTNWKAATTKDDIVPYYNKYSTTNSYYYNN